MKPSRTLDLYSEKFTRLDESSLIGSMIKPGWKISWDVQNNKPADDAKIPKLEFIEAYILNLRFFIQNNEPISLSKMSALYRTYCECTDFVTQFERVRSKFNNELDKTLFYKVNDKPITYRQVFDGMIFSQFAHSNQKDKHVLFDGLKKNSCTYWWTMDTFLRCINFVHTCLAEVNELNKQAFAYNKALKSFASLSRTRAAHAPLN